MCQPVFFFGVKRPQKGASFLQREYSVANAHLKEKEKSPNCDRKLVFAAEVSADSCLLATNL
jgi:hypothetical protein